MFSLDSTTQVDLGKLKPKDYYQLLNNKTHTAHQTGTQKWNKTFPLNENDWCQLFKSIPKLCQEQKLREFQFKFIHRIVVTRKKLFKFRIKPNSDCIYCGEEDSIEHTFKDCSFTKSFIEKTLECLIIQINVISLQVKRIYYLEFLSITPKLENW